MTRRQSQPDNPASVDRLREHLRRTPDDGNAWLALAQELSRRRSGSELYHALEQAIRSLPEREEPWSLAAQVHLRERGLAAAIHWLEHSARQNPGLAAPRKVAAALRSAGSAEEAWSRGEACRQSGRWQQALEAYRQVERADPDRAELLNNIGTCLASLERFDEAGTYFERALARRPGFPEARLNQALLCACRGDVSGALDRVDSLLGGNGLQDASRPAADQLRVLLEEHVRLAPPLREALRSGEIDALNRALAEAPAGIGETDEDAARRLRKLAARCSRMTWQPDKALLEAEDAVMTLLEACAQCNIPCEAERTRELLHVGDNQQDDDDQRCLLHAMGVQRERRSHSPDELGGPRAEAWLRYWHARLLQRGRPGVGGQYKLAANSIAGLPLTPPLLVKGTFRLLLQELLPGVPAGVPRGVLAYIAINMIHGFADGNGRLARFVLAWETSAAGLPPLLVPVGIRGTLAKALDEAWVGQGPGPVLDVLLQGQREVSALLDEL